MVFVGRVIPDLPHPPRVLPDPTAHASSPPLPCRCLLQVGTEQATPGADTRIPDLHPRCPEPRRLCRPTPCPLHCHSLLLQVGTDQAADICISDLYPLPRVLPDPIAHTSPPPQSRCCLLQVGTDRATPGADICIPDLHHLPRVLPDPIAHAVWPPAPSIAILSCCRWGRTKQHPVQTSASQTCTTCPECCRSSSISPAWSSSRPGTIATRWCLSPQAEGSHLGVHTFGGTLV